MSPTTEGSGGEIQAAHPQEGQVSPSRLHLSRVL